MTGILASLTSRVAPGLAVVDTPDEVSGFGNTGAAANITTGLVVATPTGGVPSYTYAWTQTSSSPYTWVIGTPTAASTNFTCNTLAPGTTAEAEFTVTVTDAVGQTAISTVIAFANNGQPYDDRPSRDRRSFF
jgi:hypothetical protein